MIHETTNLDQADEEILSYTVSDEALEVAAGIGRLAPTVCQCSNRLLNPGC